MLTDSCGIGENVLTGIFGGDDILAAKTSDHVLTQVTRDFLAPSFQKRIFCSRSTKYTPVCRLSSTTRNISGLSNSGINVLTETYR